jgi:ABC-2 type transport system permease protein
MNIYKMEIRRNLRSLIIWACASGAILALIMLMYPTMLNSDFMEMMEAKLKLVPKELLDMFQMSGEDIRGLPSFFATMFQFVLMAACIYGSILGINALAREQSEGTIEFLCAKPVRRSRIASAKLAAACTEYVIYFAVVGIAGILACICVRPEELPADKLVRGVSAVVLSGAVSGFTYLFLGFAMSVFLAKARAAASLAVAMFFLTYVLGKIPSFGLLGFLKWVSPISYFVPGQIAVNGSIDAVAAVVCLGVMAVCAAVAYAVYRKKDFLV